MRRAWFEPADPLLAARSVDVIFLYDAYHHINERVTYVAKIKPSLKPGGRLVIIDYARTKDNSEHSIVKDEVVDELRRAGFRLACEFDLLSPKQYFFGFEPVP
jgi:predicted methyltransferase